MVCKSAIAMQGRFPRRSLDRRNDGEKKKVFKSGTLKKRYCQKGNSFGAEIRGISEEKKEDDRAEDQISVEKENLFNNQKKEPKTKDLKKNYRDTTLASKKTGLKSYNDAYNEGFNVGFAKGFEDGHALAYQGEEI